MSEDSKVLEFPTETEGEVVETVSLSITEVRREGGMMTVEWDMSDGLTTTDIIKILAGFIFTLSNVEAEKNEGVDPVFFAMWMLHALHNEYSTMSLPEEVEG